MFQKSAGAGSQFIKQVG